MKIYSHSRLETFEKCKLKFKFQYIDKIIPEIGQSIEAHLGSVVHSTLEWLYHEIKKKEPKTIEQIISYYAEKWQEEFTDNIVIVKKEFTEKDYFNKGVGFLVNYYSKHSPFDEKTIAIEHKIELDLTEEIRLIGFIDRLVENIENNEIEIHDYKTGNSMPTEKQIKNNRQLALYSLAIKETFGKDKNICLVWHFLAHDMKICIRKTDEELENLKQEIITLIKQIEETKDFPPNKSVLCNWCQYKNICPEFTKKSNQGQEKLDIWG
ncbi:PD-(D/E)XK nuclease family protein [Candidatus Pacearchaeota archaeon]|nr:PD-(D/E)XK nuclease family protein [Candidatus Pacearchaeota archaeon]